MGCYGIGVSRLIAAIIEKNNDTAGIIWPKEVAPFDVEILPVQMSEKSIVELADKYYAAFKKRNWDVLMDDRDESAGRKFAEADLIGIPLRVTIGKRNLAEGKVEIKNRRTGEVALVAIDAVESKVAELLK
jgi:prolyl-tRNA synthetase